MLANYKTISIKKSISSIINRYKLWQIQNSWKQLYNIIMTFFISYIHDTFRLNVY